jgi:cytochrome c553
MKRVTSIVIAGVLLGMSGAALAGDAEAGKAKAASCAGCHGAEGVSSNPMWPNLAGQKEGYLVKQIKAFREGTRADPMMTPMAKPLSDEDIDNLAAYFSSL